MLEVLLALNAVIMRWSQWKVLNQMPCEDIMLCAACAGSVRGLGWSRLDVNKHLFGICLPEALISHLFLLVQVPAACSSQCRLPLCTKPGHWAMVRANTGSGEGCFFTLDQLNGWRAMHTLYFPSREGDAGAGWWGQGLPNLLLLQLVNFAFAIHLPLFQSTVLCRWQYGERYALLERLQRMPLGWSYTGI